MAAYLITGATGYIGSMLIRKILTKDCKSKVTALVRDAVKACQMLPPEVKIIQADLCDKQMIIALEPIYDYVIHCASITESAEMITHPVEVIESIVNTTQNVLELVCKGNVKSMVYLSSMEVYGNIDCRDGHRISEDETGNVEILKLRSCYPLGKRMAENICYSYYREYGIPVKIARLSQTFGQGIRAEDKRVFAQLVRAVKENRDIVLHSQGQSMGNYCGINDTVRGLIIILEKGVSGETYNVVNEENTMTIRQMAELVAEKVAGGKISVVYDIPQEDIYGYAPDTGIRLSGEKLRKLGWRPVESLEQMYLNAISISDVDEFCNESP